MGMLRKIPSTVPEWITLLQGYCGPRIDLNLGMIVKVIALF